MSDGMKNPIPPKINIQTAKLCILGGQHRVKYTFQSFHFETTKTYLLKIEIWWPLSPICHSGFPKIDLDLIVLSESGRFVRRPIDPTLFS